MFPALFVLLYIFGRPSLCACYRSPQTEINLRVNTQINGYQFTPDRALIITTDNYITFFNHYIRS